MVVENVPKMVGMAYAISSFFVLFFLFYKNKFSENSGYFFLIISSIMGFLVFAPMFPNQFQLLLLGNTGQLGAPLQIAIIGPLLFIALTLIFGKIFCGYLCPIGAIQELTYNMPIKKIKITNKNPTTYFSFDLFCCVPCPQHILFNRYSYLPWILGFFLSEFYVSFFLYFFNLDNTLDFHL